MTMGLKNQKYGRGFGFLLCLTVQWHKTDIYQINILWIFED